MKSMLYALAATMLAVAAPSYAQTATETQAIKAAELPNPPVIAGDISDRPYTVLGQVTAGVRKATAFSKAASPEKVYRELWERGQKMGADAVIHAEFGKAHISAMSWGQINATGVAIKFTAPAGAGGQ